MYQIGWIYNSEKHRQDVETIISLTKEQGTLDELGLGSIRDGFADLFFPGTTTIQTRAKYFLIIPWILEDLYNKNESFRDFSRMLRAEESRIIEILKTREDTAGLIGKDVGIKLKRMPSSVYWAGLKRFRLLLPDLALSQVGDFFTKRKRMETFTDSRRLTKEDKLSSDVAEASDQHYLISEGFPKYPGIAKLYLALTEKEANFLRTRILLETKDSLMAYVLKEKDETFISLRSFEEVVKYLGKKCPLTKALEAALLFDKVMKGAYVLYNRNISHLAQNGEEIDWDLRWTNYLQAVSAYDVNEDSFNEYFRMFQISNSTVEFCRTWINLVKAEKINSTALDNLVSLREHKLKGKMRSRLADPSLARKASLPIGIYIDPETKEVNYLSYRTGISQRIVRDIFEGLKSNNASE